MKKVILLIVFAVVLSGLYFMLSKDSTTDSMSNLQTEETVIDRPVRTTATPDKEKYVTYSSNILTNLPHERKILFFYANWCPTCRPADKEFVSGNAQIPNNVVVVRVNYNDPETDSEEKELAKTYEITYQHTFVEIDKDGKVIQRWNGGGLSELLERIQNTE